MTALRTTGPLLSELPPWAAALVIAIVQGAILGILAGLNNYLGAVPIDAPALVVAGLTAAARFIEGLIAQYKVTKA